MKETILKKIESHKYFISLIFILSTQVSGQIDDKQILREFYTAIAKSDSTSSEEYYKIFLPEERILFKSILNLLGYNTETESQEWSKENNEIVREFQKYYLLRIDGKIGPETMTTMSSLLKAYKEYFGELDQLTIPVDEQSKLVKIPDRLRIGEIVKYINPEVNQWQFARVYKLSGEQVTIHDWIRQKYYIVDIDDIE